MAIFCTKCGTSNEDEAGFCNNCGTKFRVNLVTAPTQVKVGFKNPKQIIYTAAALSVLLVLAGGISYFVLQPPAPTAATLLSATKVSYGKAANERFKDQQLCLSNIDYSKNSFNSSESDNGTAAWMKALVTAGLYSQPVVINISGLASGGLLQYASTPELANYREGSRLCVAKAVEGAEVMNIQKPVLHPVGRAGSQVNILEVKAELILKSLQTAPWMGKPEVREVILAKLNGWTYKDQSLQKKINQHFGLIDNKWITGGAYKSAVQSQIADGQRSDDLKNEILDKARNAKSPLETLGTVASSITSFFRGNKNPLFGRWQSAGGETKMIFFATGCVGSAERSNEKCSYSIDGETITFESNFRSNIFPEGRGYVIMQNQDLITVVPESGGNRFTMWRIN